MYYAYKCMYKYFKYSGLYGTSDVLADPLNLCQLENAS